MLFASSPAILTANFPPQRRGEVLGLQATLTYLGLTVGPPLGGFLAETFGWPSIFYINVPIGLVAIALSIALHPVRQGAARGRAVRLPGALTFLVGLVALLFALNQGPAWGWASPAILGLLAAGRGAPLAFFIAGERTRSPMLDLSLFADRMFSAAVRDGAAELRRDLHRRLPDAVLPAARDGA